MTVYQRALVFGAIVILAIAIAGSVAGYLVAGTSGVLSALVGAGVTALFMGFTTLSLVIAGNTGGKPASNSRYFAIVVGMWLSKFVLFIVVLVAVREQPWLNAYVFLFVLIAAVIGSLVVDVIALAGARVPYVGDIELPGSPASAPSAPDPSP